MQNRKSIQILGGSKTYNVSTSEEILLDRQPFYSKLTKKLYIGDGVTKLKDLEPIAVYADDLEEIILSTESNIEEIQNIKDNLSNYQTVNDETLNTDNKNIPGAINELESNKLDKDTSASGYVRLYGINPDGTLINHVVGTSEGSFSANRIASIMSNDRGNTEPSGYLISHTPIQPYQVANKKYVDAVGNRVALLEDQYQIMNQQVIQPVEASYQARPFANEMIVFDNNGVGGKSRLLTIEGNSANCKNIFDPYEIVDETNDMNQKTSDYVIVEQKDSIVTYTIAEDFPFNKLTISTFMPIGINTFSAAAVSGTINSEATYPFKITDKSESVVCYESYTIDEEGTRVAKSFPLLNTFVELPQPNRFYITFLDVQPGEVIHLNKFQIEMNDCQTEFIPHYKGIKSPIITGIETKSLFSDLTKINSLNSLGVPCGLGRTIDFEKNQIVDKFVEITFDGSEDEDWKFEDYSTEDYKKYHIYIDLPIDTTGENCLSWNQTKLYTEFSMYCYAFYSQNGLAHFGTLRDDTPSLESWKTYLQGKMRDGTPLILRYVTKDVQAVADFESNISTADFDKKRIITIFNQGTQKPILTSSSNNVINEQLLKVPVTITQEVLVSPISDQVYDKEFLLPIASKYPENLTPNIGESFITGQEGEMYQFKFSGGADFVYSTLTNLNKGERLVAEFNIETTREKIMETQWFSLSLVNEQRRETYPHMHYNMRVYYNDASTMWGGDYIVDNSINTSLGVTQVIPNNGKTYCYKAEVTKVDDYSYNYRLLRSSSDDSDGWAIIDEIYGIDTLTPPEGVSANLSYEVKSIAISCSGTYLEYNEITEEDGTITKTPVNPLTLNNLVFYKEQL